tara:strand:+ start:593 stop:1051 length:459 start_codon:yes stop_codon:yes gene_type:complete
MKILKLAIIINTLFFLYNCTEKTIYTGKIINEKEFNYENIENKNQLLDKLGNADYIDPIENKYYYFTEKRKVKNFLNEKIVNRSILVFSFNKDETIKKINDFDINDESKLTFSKEKTINNIVKRGLLEKWFGGVGKSQSAGLPTSSIPDASK